MRHFLRLELIGSIGQKWEAKIYRKRDTNYRKIQPTMVAHRI